MDWASAAPISPAARRAFERARAAYGNPSSPHAEGRAGREILETARTTIARLAEVKAEAVIFTSGATEANNLAIQGLAMERRTGAPAAKLHALYLPSAHASVVESLEALRSFGIEAEPLVIENGSVSIPALEKQLRPETFLVSMDAVCGETGTRWDTRAVRRALDEHAKAHAQNAEERAQLHVDASQLPLAESFELTRLAADLMTLDAQKVGGVRGIGALLKRPALTLAPLLHGGGQEQGLRAGTENPALAAAFAASLEECARDRAPYAARASAARARLVAQLSAAIPDLLVNEGKHGVPHILNVSLPGRDTDYAVALLDEADVAASTKSACETDSGEGSRAVLALTSDSARAASTLRLSWGPATAGRELDRAAEALIRTVRFLDTHSGTAV